MVRGLKGWYLNSYCLSRLATYQSGQAPSNGRRSGSGGQPCRECFPSSNWQLYGHLSNWLANVELPFYVLHVCFTDFLHSHIMRFVLWLVCTSCLFWQHAPCARFQLFFFCCCYQAVCYSWNVCFLLHVFFAGLMAGTCAWPRPEVLTL